jgi:hypothetical protein
MKNTGYLLGILINKLHDLIPLILLSHGNHHTIAEQLLKPFWFWLVQVRDISAVIKKIFKSLFDYLSYTCFGAMICVKIISLTMNETFFFYIT